MPAIRLPSDAESEAQGFRGPESQRRRDVLRETLAAFEQCAPAGHYHRLAAHNLARWAEAAVPRAPTPAVLVLRGDWGDVTQALTRQFGTCFAVLNMANAFFPGGAYGEGAVAQEENLFRRTDCHFQVHPEHLGSDGRTYTVEMTHLLTARAGRVFLDATAPRVCVRGREDRSSPDLGYAWLPESEVFPFFELKAAAQDLRDGADFDVQDARRRIAAQLDTLVAHGVRHAVLGAFGCGAFLNPAHRVARLYHEEIDRRPQGFDVLAFAIFSPGYGPDNFLPFASEFQAGT